MNVRECTCKNNNWISLNLEALMLAFDLFLSNMELIFKSQQTFKFLVACVNSANQKECDLILKKDRKKPLQCPTGSGSARAKGLISNPVFSEAGQNLSCTASNRNLIELAHWLTTLFSAEKYLFLPPNGHIYFRISFFLLFLDLFKATRDVQVLERS